MTAAACGFVDRTGDDVTGARVVTLDDLPRKYLPVATRFHDEDLRPEWGVVPQSYLLDDTWDAGLLSEIERVYANAIGFAFFTGPEADRQFPAGLLTFSMNGGIPIVHIFRGLRGSMPRNQRPRSSSVAAASPGVLTIDAPSDRVGQLMRAVRALAKSKGQYAVVQDWAKTRPRNVDDVPIAHARDSLRRLCNLLSVSVEKILQVQEGADGEKEALLVAGKVVTAYYRMLGRVSVPKRSGAEFLGMPPGGYPEVPDGDGDDDEEEDEEDFDDSE